MSQYQQGYGDQTRRVDEYGNPLSQGQVDQYGNPISGGGMTGATGHGHHQQHHGVGVDQTTGFGSNTGTGTGYGTHTGSGRTHTGN